MSEPKLASEQCAVRENLVESIKAVMAHLVVLHRREIGAVRNWDIDAMERIDHDVERANARRDSLLDRLKSHGEGHGCQQTRVRGYGPLSEWGESRKTDPAADELDRETGHREGTKSA